MTDGNGKKVNCYRCKAGHKTWTIHRDPGTTPFIITCRHAGCDEQAESSFYLVDQNAMVMQGPLAILHPTLEEAGDVGCIWVRPDEVELDVYREQVWGEAESFCQQQIDGPDEPMLGGDTLKSIGVTTARAYFDRFFADGTRDHVAEGGCVLLDVLGQKLKQQGSQG